MKAYGNGFVFRKNILRRDMNLSHVHIDIIQSPSADIIQSPSAVHSEKQHSPLSINAADVALQQ